jgi:hypothetical protein
MMACHVPYLYDQKMNTKELQNSIFRHFVAVENGRTSKIDLFRNLYKNIWEEEGPRTFWKTVRHHHLGTKKELEPSGRQCGVTQLNLSLPTLTLDVTLIVVL